MTMLAFQGQEWSGCPAKANWYCRQAGNRETLYFKAGNREKGNPEEFREFNDVVMRAVKQYPDRFVRIFHTEADIPERIAGRDKPVCWYGKAGYKGYNTGES